MTQLLFKSTETPLAFPPVFSAMKARAIALSDASTAADECWLLSHTPVYTMGLRDSRAHLLHASTIPLIKTDRGGQITYHGPGQWMGYCLFDVARLSLSGAGLVHRLEAWLVKTLADFGVVAFPSKSYPGVYVADEVSPYGMRKIASLGLRVKARRSYHGFALNVAMSLSPFSGINPCGILDMPMTSLAKELGESSSTMKEVRVRALMREVAVRLRANVGAMVYEGAPLEVLESPLVLQGGSS